MQCLVFASLLDVYFLKINKFLGNTVTIEVYS